MLLSAVLVRFYKSFNFDYLRKYDHAPDSIRPWELVDGEFYPFVRIPIEDAITTIVGANESGKSHLLSAIEKGLSGLAIERDDFCRNSKFFSVEEGALRWPDFGFEWTGLTDAERSAVVVSCGADERSIDRSFCLLRTDRDTLTVVLRDGEHRVDNAAPLVRILPNVFRLLENVALPESVSIRFLAGDDVTATSGLAALQRSHRNKLVQHVWERIGDFTSKETLTRSAESIAAEMSALSASGRDADGRLEAARRQSERQLAYDLIRKVARIDSEMLSELLEALTDGRDAFANSIIAKINESLQARLNFPHWWVQDKDFRLLVSPRDYDLTFTIRDRTEKEYAFTERSSGLRYFLSYYIQYLAHSPSATQHEILLMDEPDAYLSNQGQQDLLKILDAFAHPNDKDALPIQVVYVTHSPFLIDKNHGERIRVLQKGVADEGTRVVNDASRNHYEPLRSAFGSFVAETAFIGNCNLIVEGTADQIILGGAASLLRSRGAADIENLDLNHITIVPAGGAPHVPYLVFLARGRDVEKPAVIVLLDSDKPGNDARQAIRRGGPRHKQLLKDTYVLQIGELGADAVGALADGQSLIETEDLIPTEIAVLAAKRYLDEVWALPIDSLQKITVEALDAASGTLVERLKATVQGIDPELSLDKIGFARSLVQTIGVLTRQAPPSEALALFERRMRGLFRRLKEMQRNAERDLTAERVSSRFGRARSSFFADHPSSAKREHVVVLFEEIDGLLDDSEESDAIKTAIQSLRREFKIDEGLTEDVPDYSRFRDALDGVRYAARLANQENTLQGVIANSMAEGAPSGDSIDNDGTE